MGTGPFALLFERTYNSNRTYDNNPVPIGVGWSHSYSSRVIGIGTSGGGVTRAIVERPDGRVLKFTLIGTLWQSDADVSERLAWSTDGSGAPIAWTYTTNDDAVETYDAEGRLMSITSRDGFVQSLSYTDTSNLPRDHVQKVTDPQGRTLRFGYNSGGQLISLTDGNGKVIQYAYDTSGNLQTATYPDTNSGNTTRTYHYNETGQTGGTSQPHALTGITDENNDRYASWGYTVAGKANLSVHGPFSGGTIDRTSLTFNGNGTTTVTDCMGQDRVFGFQVQFLVARGTALDEPCDYCGTNFASRIFDSHGYPSSGSDFRSFKTGFTYNARGLETQRIEAVGENKERTIDTTWNANFRVPTQRRVVNHAATIEKRTDLVYNSRGQPTARCAYDLTQSGASSYTCAASGSVPVGIRRWVITYCDTIDLTPPDSIGSMAEKLAKGCPLVGLVRRVDGPRTDVNDRMTYQYYLADDTASSPKYRSGDPSEVIDALGHTTDYLAYGGNGRVLRMQDANGVLTDSIWHPRGWLLARSVRALASGSPSANDATTTMAYDGVGNLTGIEQPDGVSMTYTHDNAHRLTTITDDLGNHIDYTLDALGHRVAEKTFDVNNATTPSLFLTRTWNALSRLTHEYDAQSRDTQYAYDGNGNRTDKTDPLGVKT
ncbi:MAG: DUF6531 domain-containing protein, partial [Xanthomonadales bacterium]|nr:DUF6531 domain-containing protein [Xanthomonadales bacterium]